MFPCCSKQDCRYSQENKLNAFPDGLGYQWLSHTQAFETNWSELIESAGFFTPKYLNRYVYIIGNVSILALFLEIKNLGHD